MSKGKKRRIKLILGTLKDGLRIRERSQSTLGKKIKIIVIGIRGITGLIKKERRKRKREIIKEIDINEFRIEYDRVSDGFNKKEVWLYEWLFT